MSTTLDFDLKKAPPELFEHGRWDVLTQMIIHTNERNRCWPTVRRIGLRASKSLETVNEAKKWLKSVGAIIDVPFDQRVGKELGIPKRQCVYEVTGIIKIDEKEYPYLYLEKVDHGDVEDVTPSETSSVDPEGDVTPSETNDVTPSRISEGVTKVYIRENTSDLGKGIQREDSPKPAVASSADADSDNSEGVKGESGPSTVVSPGLALAPLENPYTWIVSSAVGTLAHIAKQAKGRPLCKASLPHRSELAAPIGLREPCPDCNAHYRIAIAPAPPRLPRVTQDHMRPIEAWRGELESTLPRAFDVGAFARVSKEWYEAGVTPDDMRCAACLFKAWIAAHPGAPVVNWQVKVMRGVIDGALVLCKVGITDADMTQYVKEQKEDSFWSGKSVSFDYVTKNLPTWKAEKAPPAVKQDMMIDPETGHPITVIAFKKRQQLMEAYYGRKS